MTDKQEPVFRFDLCRAQTRVLEALEVDDGVAVLFFGGDVTRWLGVEVSPHGLWTLAQHSGEFLAEGDDRTQPAVLVGDNVDTLIALLKAAKSATKAAVADRE